MIKAALKSLLHTVTGPGRLHLLLGLFVGVFIGNVTATLSRGRPDAAQFMVGLVTGVGITVIVIIMGLEASDKIKEAKVTKRRKQLAEQTGRRARTAATSTTPRGGVQARAKVTNAQ